MLKWLCNVLDLTVGGLSNSVYLSVTLLVSQTPSKNTSKTKQKPNTQDNKKTKHIVEFCQVRRVLSVSVKRTAPP